LDLKSPRNCGITNEKEALAQWKR